LLPLVSEKRSFKKREVPIVLNVTVEKFAETAILHCVGRIVRGDETDLLCAAVGQHGRSIILDLEKTDALDAAGVGALISLHAAGVYLRLINPSKAIREVLRLTHLDSIFEISGAPLSTDHKETDQKEYEQDSDPHHASPPFSSPVVASAT
jgi:anti-anti-sigma factor